MKVLIVGGTGLIGYHALKEFLRRGHHVAVVALPSASIHDLLPGEVEVKLAALEELPDSELSALLARQDAVVFAAGKDDRDFPKKPAYEFYYNANVKSCRRLFKLAREAGVKRGALIGSYLTHFDRIWPEKELSKHHPYIRARREQTKESFEVALPDLELMVLELPYVFGSMRGAVPLWAPLIDYVGSPLPLIYFKGGTNMIAAERVAEAVVGAIERGRGGEIYVVGDQNVTYKDWLEQLSRLVGKNQKVRTLPNFVTRFALRIAYAKYRLQGKEAGLNLVKFGDQLGFANTFFDPTPAREALGYGQGGLDEALKATVEACPAKWWSRRRKALD